MTEQEEYGEGKQHLV